jgi:catechol 2,3-dioxygenase-like lactoylglutathione lyase family enzyme
MKVDSLDHLVLTVRDIAKTCDFYERALGMQRVEFMPDRWALRFGQQKLNLHPADRVVDPLVRHATPGSADLCFLTTTPMPELIAHLNGLGLEIIRGPGKRHGATSDIDSVYIYDPDGNLIEIANRL